MPPPNPQLIQSDTKALHNALNRFNVDEKTLIQIIATRDPASLAAIRSQYSGDLISTLEKKTYGNFETCCMATASGPAGAEAFFAYQAMKGAGTNEAVLIGAVLGKTNHELTAIKAEYQRMYGSSLESKIKGDLSGYTENLFVYALKNRKPDEHIPANPTQTHADMKAFYKATAGRLGTSEDNAFEILTRLNSNQMRALAAEYKTKHGELLRCIKSEFSGTQREALEYIVEGGTDPVGRDARILNASMVGSGTRDLLLISTLVRCHWNRQHMEAVKQAYQRMFGQTLVKAVKKDTSGDYEDFLVKLIDPF